MAKVEKFVGVTTYTLELSEDEAQLICDILSHTGGSGERRKHLDSIIAALGNVNMNFSEKKDLRRGTGIYGLIQIVDPGQGDK